MVRGTIPRQPSKAGRHEGVKQQPRRAESRGGSRETRTAKAHTLALPGAGSRPRGSGKRKPAYDPLAPERIAGILRALDQAYPAATCALRHQSAWELLVATILSAQCTDARVNMVTPELFRKYPSVRHFAQLKPEELEPDIRSTGFFRNKSKAITGAARQIVEQFGGSVPEEMDQLLLLPGVARKTANVVLGTWFGKAEGVVVDTHVQRIARRLELTSHEDPGKIEQDLMREIPRDRWTLFAHQLILHGRALCVARQPKCASCPLEKLCHAPDKTWSTHE
jgi:endonuclease-3